MKERRLFGFLGEGGCEPAVEGEEALRVVRVAEGATAGERGDKGEMDVEMGVGRECKGCSW